MNPGPHGEGPATLPLAVHEERHRAFAAERERWATSERRLASLRLLVFLAAVLLALGAAETGWLSPVWAAVPGAAFLALVLRHDRVIRARQRAERLSEFHARGQARLQGRWAGQGRQGERFLDPHHPFAADLDVFGKGSLFERLAEVRTEAAERLLAEWLSAPTSPAEARRRQQAVAELRPRLDLREDFALLGDAVPSSLEARRLRQWGEGPALPWLRGWRFLTLGLVGAMLLVGGLAGVGGPIGPWILLLLTQAAVALWLRRSVASILRGIDVPDRELSLFAAILARLESEKFASPPLVALQARLQSGGRSPSTAIDHLHRLVQRLDARRNQLFAPLSWVLLWATQGALAVEQWRVRHGAAIADWLDVAAEFEALLAVAGYAFENPADPFPEYVEGGPLFVAEGLAHPLLPADTTVRNDVSLGEAARVLVVSGSNMSGKSTLLRSVGTNLLLASVGAPVRARSLRLADLGLGASLRTLDSLQEGTSRFYAEISRLRQLMDLAKAERPLLFLLDEILHGTNSHDRGVGAGGVVRGFLARGAIGLVTTHDLALTRLAEDLGADAANVHFEDQMVEGRMVFDYRMRPGVVTHSNALALMRAVGLEV